MKKKFGLLLVLSLLVSVFFNVFSVNAQEPVEIDTLKVAFVPSRDPEEIITTTEPLKQLLIDELAKEGFNVKSVEITVGTSLKQLVKEWQQVRLMWGSFLVERMFYLKTMSMLF